MRSDYITRAKKFIPTIDVILSYNHRTWDIEEDIEMFNQEKKRKVIFSHGLTRYAFITSDYVIKVDYSPDAIENFGGCEDEIEIYAQAEQDGMEHLFAKITRYDYNGTSYYIMPRLYGIGRKEDDAYDWMTEDELEWVQEHGICDLHNLNYGWRKGHVCIIDYGAHD